MIVLTKRLVSERMKSHSGPWKDTRHTALCSSSQCTPYTWLQTIQQAHHWTESLYDTSISYSPHLDLQWITRYKVLPSSPLNRKKGMLIASASTSTCVIIVSWRIFSITHSIFFSFSPSLYLLSPLLFFLSPTHALLLNDNASVLECALESISFKLYTGRVRSQLDDLSACTS